MKGEFPNVGEPKHRIFIATPLAAANVETIRAVDPARVEVIYEPDLLPPIRYVGDHGGAPFARNKDQERRWREALSSADILWDLPRTADDMAAASRLKWVQTTSTGVGQDVNALGVQDSDILITTARGPCRPARRVRFHGTACPFSRLAPSHDRAAGASLGALLR